LTKLQNPIIELSGIDFQYAAQQPVHAQLDFRVESGEQIGIVGPNGAGKTSLFHLIVGLLFPISGQIVIFGRARCQERDFWEVRERVGLLFQDPDDQLFCPTVAEDIAFGPMNLGKSRQETEKIVARTLGRLGLEHLSERVTHHLSGGEKRLISLAAVLAMEPEVLLLDEPTAGLAADKVERVIDTLEQHVSTCVVISHDQPFLTRVASRICRMEGGRIHPA
jgi:cobalt/nickel transport system ATP-binding protein